MPVIGININSIEAKNNRTSATNITVNSTPRIENIEKKDVELVKNVLSFAFTFETKYVPDVGIVKIKGEVLYQTNIADKVLKKWKKEKKIDDNIAVEVLNAIFRRCLTASVLLTHDLRLPPPIRFPVVKKKEDSEYIG